jgi:hypothetical protein
LKFLDTFLEKSVFPLSGIVYYEYLFHSFLIATSVYAYALYMLASNQSD